MEGRLSLSEVGEVVAFKLCLGAVWGRSLSSIAQPRVIFVQMWGTAFKLGLGWAGGEYASAGKRDNWVHLV